MPLNGEARKYLSDLVKGVSTFAEDTGIRFNYDTVTVEGTGSVDNIGIPVIWDNVAGSFEVFVAQDIPTVISTGGSPLPDGSVIALTVGNGLGLGLNPSDTDISSGALMTVMYRGDAGIVNEGIEWGTAAAPDQAAFLAQLEEQRITTVANAQVVTPAYTS